MSRTSQADACVPGPALSHALLLVGVLLVASNLRALISAVGPVLPLIGRDTGMSPSQLGLLAAMPVAAFAICSPLVHRVAERWGTDRTLFGAMLVLAVGTVLRSVPTASDGVWSLMSGTFVIGAAIAVGNVLLPVVVRRDFPGRVPRITGYYIAVQSIVAGAASGFVVPLSEATGSWRLALACAGALIVLALVWWLPRLSRGAQEDAPAVEPGQDVRVPSVWRSSLAWQVASYFGVQSTSFYVLLNWLPTVEQDLGVSPAVAGAHLSAYLVVGVLANLTVAPFLTLRGDQRIAAVAVGAWLVIAMAGLLALPSLVVVWVALSGLALGASMVLSLSLISMRAGGGSGTSRLSSMVQAVAYSGVALGLFGAGWIREATGPGQGIVVYVLLLGVVQVALGFKVGRVARLRAA